eukprot:4398242-Lingulodinium_polyedra.AAC.1
MYCMYQTGNLHTEESPPHALGHAAAENTRALYLGKSIAGKTRPGLAIIKRIIPYAQIVSALADMGCQ